MKASDIIKIVDIDVKEFYPEFITWLEQNATPTYADTDNVEHIYNTVSIIERIEKDKIFLLPPMVITQLAEVDNLLNQYEAIYFRITY